MSEGKRKHLMIEVYCHYDGAELTVHKMQMDGARLVLDVKTCVVCQQRNMTRGVDMAMNEIKEAAKKPLKVMEEMTQ